MKSIDSMTPEEAANLSLEEVMQIGAKRVCVSLALTMYFKEPLANFPDALAQVIEAYLEHAEPHLRWYADWVDTKYRSPTADRLRLPMQILRQRKYQTKKNFGWIYLGGAHYGDYSAWLFDARNQLEYPDTLSYLNITFPVDYWYSNYQGFAEWVKKVVRLVPVFHGHAGFAFNEHQNPGGAQSKSSEFVYPLAMRFHGIEVDRPSLTAMSCYKSIKGVNWFTLVNNELLDTLGGPNMTTAALERAGGITIDRMPWGLCIQAGNEPGIGDVNADPKPLPLYRKVNKVLRWIRTSTHEPLGDDKYERSFGEVGTLRWLRRFDDPAGEP